MHSQAHSAYAACPMSLATRLGLALLLGGAPGCSSGSAPEPASAPPAADLRSPAPPARQPMTIRMSDYYFHVDGEKMSGSLSPAGTAYAVAISDAPADLHYQVGSYKGEADSKGRARFEIDLRAALGRATLAELKRFDPGLTLILETPTRHGEAKLPPLPFDSLVTLLAHSLEKGPFSFGDEPKDANEHDCLLFSAGPRSAMLPRPCKLEQVDQVALPQLGEVRGKKTCGGYGDLGFGPGHKTLSMSLHETRVDLYERRTGKLLQTKVFPPDTECPKAVTVQTGEHDIDNRLNLPKAEAWLKDIARKL